MNAVAINDFVYTLARRRFFEILKEFASGLGIAGELIDHLSGESPSQILTSESISEEYPGDLRINCLLQASRTVQTEIQQHFRSQRYENSRALINEMATDKQMRLKLQIEYGLRYIAGMEEVLEGLLDADRISDEQLNALNQRQMGVAWKEIDEQIRQVVRTEVNSWLIRSTEPLPRGDLPQGELEKNPDKLEAIDEGGSLEGPQSVNNSEWNNRQHAGGGLQESNDQISEISLQPERNESSSTPADRQDTISELVRDQARFKERLTILGNQVKTVEERVALFHTSMEQIIETSLEGLKEELSTRIQDQFDGARNETHGHREEVQNEVAALHRRLDSLWSENGWGVDKVSSLLDRKLQDHGVPPELHSVIESIGKLKMDVEKLALREKQDSEARLGLRKLEKAIEGPLESLATLEGQFSQLNTSIENAVEEALEEFLSAKSEALACVVVREVDRIEQWILGNLKGTKPQDLMDFLKEEKAKGSIGTNPTVTKEFIELVQRRLNSKSDSQRWLKRR